MLTKEFKAKAELFQLEIKLNRLRKAKFSSEIQESISENEEQEFDGKEGLNPIRFHALTAVRKQRKQNHRKTQFSPSEQRPNKGKSALALAETAGVAHPLFRRIVEPRRPAAGVASVPF